MTINRFLISLCTASLMLSGCITAPSKPESPPQPERTKPESAKPSAAPPPEERTSPWTLGSTSIFDRERHADDELLVYAKRFEELSAENQKKEQALVMQTLGRNKKDTFTRLKAAWIYSLPNSRFRDNTKALAVIAELQREKNLEDDVSAVIALMKSFIEDRQKLEDNSLRLNQRIRDEQHRADELQMKLDALKNIDKTMIDRGQGTRK